MQSIVLPMHLLQRMILHVHLQIMHLLHQMFQHLLQHVLKMNPIGVVSCNVPGTNFTLAGVTAVYVATSVDTPFTNATGKLTDYINQQMIMLNIKPARAWLPNTLLSLFPTDSLGFQGSNYPTAGSSTTLYAFPR
eukprot:UN08462